jgi:hypothetical protein
VPGALPGARQAEVQMTVNGASRRVRLIEQIADPDNRGDTRLMTVTHVQIDGGAVVDVSRRGLYFARINGDGRLNLADQTTRNVAEHAATLAGGGTVAPPAVTPPRPAPAAPAAPALSVPVPRNAAAMPVVRPYPGVAASYADVSVEMGGQPGTARVIGTLNSRNELVISHVQIGPQMIPVDSSRPRPAVAVTFNRGDRSSRINLADNTTRATITRAIQDAQAIRARSGGRTSVDPMDPASERAGVDIPPDIQTMVRNERHNGVGHLPGSAAGPNPIAAPLPGAPRVV